jgi:hypothetical protein
MQVAGFDVCRLVAGAVPGRKRDAAMVSGLDLATWSGAGAYPPAV